MAGAILTTCIAGLLALTLWLLCLGIGDMSATRNHVVCPVCHQTIRQAADRKIMLPHTGTTGKNCPMSGQRIGATP